MKNDEDERKKKESNGSEGWSTVFDEIELNPDFIKYQNDFDYKFFKENNPEYFKMLEKYGAFKKDEEDEDEYEDDKDDKEWLSPMFDEDEYEEDEGEGED